MAQPSTGSTGITSPGYDPTTKALPVICKSSDACRYAGVPKEVYDTLIEAESKEQFIRESVEGRYPREKYPCMAVGEIV